MTLQELFSTTNNNEFVLFSDDAAPDTIEENTEEWDCSNTIFKDEYFEENFTGRFINNLSPLIQIQSSRGAKPALFSLLFLQ